MGYVLRRGGTSRCHAAVTSTSPLRSSLTAVFPATLFDYNGVLVDDENVHFEAFCDALAPYGVTLTSGEYVERYLGYDDRGAFQAILSDRGHSPTPEEITRLVEAKKPLYLTRAARGLATFPGAADLVRRCAEFGPVAVVSGALRDEIALGLDVLGVRALVEHVVSAEDTRACKPDPEGYRLGVEYLTRRLGADAARRALVVEDSIAGVQAAKAAGLVCVAVTHSYARAPLLESGADLVVDALEELTSDALSALFRSVHA